MEFALITYHGRHSIKGFNSLQEREGFVGHMNKSKIDYKAVPIEREAAKLFATHAEIVSEDHSVTEKVEL